MTELKLWAGAAIALMIAVEPAGAAPPIWTVHGSKGEITLFGSVHMLPPGQDWLTPALTTALSRADSLWFELPIDAATDDKALRLTSSRARLPAGDSLWNHVTAPQRDRIERAATTLNLSPAALAELQPWMAELTISLADARRAGADVREGVETRVQARVRPGTPRRALETVEAQVGVLTGGPLADQVASLDEAARDAVDDPGLYDRTVREWLSGDIASLERDSLDPLRRASPSGLRRLVVDRNRRWVRTLERLARTPGNAVVVVGVAHLIGPDGVPALLRARGLDVQGPESPSVSKSLARPD
jgi:uncharacterized protein YbaP (TraB family)